MRSFRASAVLEDDSFVVVWESTGVPEDVDGEAVMARRFDEDGKPVADEFLVNQEVAGSQRNPDVADLGCGRFVVVWLGPSADLVPGKNSVVARMFAAP
jgi:hypothetical protein